LAPQRPEGRPADQGVASRIFVLLRRSDFGGPEDVMHNAFLALTAAGLAGLSGYGINAQTTPVQTAQVVNSAPDYSQEAGVFSQWLSTDAPQCVAVSKIGSVAHLTKLTREQFEFVRALYVAIPPISRALPPGDSAVVASVSGRSMIALVSRGDTCARSLAPDFVLSMLTQVGKGESVAAGGPI
jgi:hypothetical protein